MTIKELIDYWARVPACSVEEMIRQELVEGGLQHILMQIKELMDDDDELKTQTQHIKGKELEAELRRLINDQLKPLHTHTLH